ncbi:MAG: adenine-specific methyltransferase EcoRI family protein [Acidimicrobiia bacterium]
MTDANRKLSSAKAAKKDEFYTQLPDIERELKHYRDHFRDKVVYCNCDDPRVSNFFKYFSYNFEQLGLKKLITTCYRSQHRDLFSQNDSERAISLEYTGIKDPDGRVPDPEDIGVRLLESDGDFRNAESIELLEQADIVVTNPPFSLFREYVSHLIKYDKQFLIIGHQNAIKYKETFPLIKADRLWLGYGFPGGATHFASEYEDTATATDRREGMIRISGVHWFTNLEHNKRHEDLILYKSYNPEEYPTYDNFHAIEVAKTKDIPADYDGVMGVPITFMDKYNPDQFEIVGITQSWAGAASKTYPRQVQVSANGKRQEVTKLNDGPALKMDSPPGNTTYYMVGDDYFTQLYARILIRRRGGN